MQSIQALNQTGRNNFNLLRIVFASLVVVAHAFLIYTDQDIDPRPHVAALYYVGNGVLDGFFLFSGFMVAGSILNRASIGEYFIARAFRIYPALIVVVLASALLIGPVVTSLDLSAYFADARTYLYILITGTTTDADQALPGVFEGHAATSVVNASLWTLRYELLLYLFTAAVFAAGLLNRRWMKFIAGLVVALYAAKIAFLGIRCGIPFIDHMAHFGLSYVLGMMTYIYQDRIPLAWPLALLSVVLAWLTHGTQLAEFTKIIAVCYVIFWLAYLPSGALRHYNKAGDYSYGIYIWHWPVASMLLALWPALDPVELIALTFMTAFPLAIASWHFIEKPALAAKKPAAIALERTLNAYRSKRLKAAE